MHTPAWNAEHRALWQRLSDHAFERDDGSLDFVAKLARQQGWTREHARAAVAEYRKFCFLAAACSHAVTPSEEVDQVWHLHLTYTVDYWDRFCPDVLGLRLHHEGSDGRAQTRSRHRDDYARTLASYQQWFGNAPDAFWPGTAARFASSANFRWIDRRRHFVIPRPSLPSARRLLAAVAALVIAPAAIALPLNPFDWTGPQFLGLYIAVLLVGAIAAWIVRDQLVDEGQRGDGSGLQPLEIAYLAGGKQRAIDAGVAELMSADALRWNNKQFVRGSRGAETSFLSDLREWVLARQEKKPWTKSDKVFDALRKPLILRGLIPDVAADWRGRLMSAAILATVAAFGWGKVVVGATRGRPTGILSLLTIAATAAAIMLLLRHVPRSRAGARVLKALRVKHATTTRAPRNDDLGLAVALLGTTALTGTAYASYHQHRAASSGSDSSSSGCSSDSGSSCSSGCGGCGGGGD